LYQPNGTGLGRSLEHLIDLSKHLLSIGVNVAVLDQVSSKPVYCPKDDSAPTAVQTPEIHPMKCGVLNRGYLRLSIKNCRMFHQMNQGASPPCPVGVAVQCTKTTL
jgi:hypothetical protein